MSHLAPCPTCHRHVEVVESACPFCAAVLSESFRAQPAPVPPPRRLSRAAMMAAGATLLGACSAVPVYGAPTGMGGSGAAGGIAGAGGMVTGGSSGSTDAGKDSATDAAPARDAAQDRSAVAIYGAAFAGDRTSEKPNS
jgi:hypothetical protein